MRGDLWLIGANVSRVSNAISKRNHGANKAKSMFISDVGRPLRYYVQIMVTNGTMTSVVSAHTIVARRPSRLAFAASHTSVTIKIALDHPQITHPSSFSWPIKKLSTRSFSHIANGVANSQKLLIYIFWTIAPIVWVNRARIPSRLTSYQGRYFEENFFISVVELLFLDTSPYRGRPL
ncbi:unnamed protein product [Strongylus vulgaris]|uniref:Uncharacterized protein n=1 Tax=Strongylus vulgaris TaxID=40348 RepID=A0A3P7JCF8_STRVU|nr:unnamed protein product [Strongylus vulgaris]